MIFTKYKTLVAINLMKNDKEPAEIIKNVFLGSVGTALSKRKLDELKITHILSLVESMKVPYESVNIYLIIYFKILIIN